MLTCRAASPELPDPLGQPRPVQFAHLREDLQGPLQVAPCNCKGPQLRRSQHRHARSTHHQDVDDLRMDVIAWLNALQGQKSAESAGLCGLVGRPGLGCLPTAGRPYPVDRRSRRPVQGFLAPHLTLSMELVLDESCISVGAASLGQLPTIPEAPCSGIESSLRHSGRHVSKLLKSKQVQNAASSASSRRAADAWRPAAPRTPACAKSSVSKPCLA